MYVTVLYTAQFNDYFVCKFTEISIELVFSPLGLAKCYFLSLSICLFWVINITIQVSLY